MSKRNRKIRVGISIGDLNGVGMEVIMKTFDDNRMNDMCTPIVYGSTRVASYHRKALKMESFKFHVVQNADQADANKANLVNCWKEEVRMRLGTPNKEAGKYAFKSLEMATRDLASNKVDVLVTAPIDKSTIQSSEFNFNGHTEYLANYANEENPLMIMVSDKLRVGMATGHIPLKDVSKSLSIELIINKVNVMAKSLTQDFAVIKPRIAVLGLNPHAGDEGLLGDEEKNIIYPAILKLQKAGHVVFGPFGADGFFGSGAFKNFDGVLAMYHDQGLIPFKTLSFENGVNYTAGLPIVRTSPDHGTGYDIAGKKTASPSSFRNAVYTACDIYRTRRMYREMTANPLTPIPHQELIEN